LYVFHQEDFRMKLRVNLLILAAAFSTVALAQPVNQGVLSACYPISGAATTATGTTCQSAFQVRYFANLTVGDSFIDITNDGSVITAASVAGSSTTTANYSTGNICINVYTFDPAEEEVSCCSCLVTPNGLVSLSAVTDLIGNTLTPASPTAITVKLLATTPIIQGTNPLTASQSCNPAFPFGVNNTPSGTLTTTPVGATIAGTTTTLGATSSAQNIAPAMHAWGTTLHAQPGGTFGATETEFSNAALGVVSAVGLNRTVDEFTRLSSNCSFIQSNGSGFGICRSCRAGGLGAVRQ